MRFGFVLAFLLLGTGFAFAQSVQSPQCLPATDEAKGWPIKAIYMHGLFKGEGGPDTNGFRALEAGNRKKLDEYARKLKIRIAVPVAPVNGQFRNWNSTGIKQVEKQAREACGGATLAEGRALIGFSNGGYRSRKYAHDCESTRGYAAILSIGAPNNTTTAACAGTKHVNTAPHVMPDFSYFEKHLANLGRGAPSGKSPAPGDSRR
ncbi:MAG: hypothetical protein KF767_14025 [Bdellovibrionaceae bacterium]|nr:hypothetical protein [Pseudobdellovibrionaceae bacterium]